MYAKQLQLQQLPSLFIGMYIIKNGLLLMVLLFLLSFLRIVPYEPLGSGLGGLIRF